MSNGSAHVMVSAGEIAGRDGVTKAAVTKLVRRLADQGMPVERDGRGRISKFAQAWYDDHRAQHGDSIKSNRKAEASPVIQKDSLDEARRIEAWLKVDREKLKKQQMAGSLLRRDKLETALEELAAVVLTTIQKLPNRADELVTAVSKEGVHGLRLALRKVAFDMGTDISDKLERLADEASVTDPLVDPENE